MNNFSNLTLSPALSRYFLYKSETIIPTKSYKRKHLLVINFESLENQALGLFMQNPECNQSMPYMSNLTKHSIFAINGIVPSEVTYTMASLFAAECGLPFIVPKKVWYTKQFHASGAKHCVSDILHKIGYKNEWHAADGLNFGGMKSFLKSHHWNVTTKPIHFKDKQLFEYTIKNLFPKLHQTKQPYYIVLETMNSHIFFDFFEEGCEKRIPETCGKKLLSYDCTDQLIERFFAEFERQKLYLTTEVLIYGDHPVGDNPNNIFKSPRKIPIFYLYHGAKILNKQVSVYDIGPTLLDILGLRYIEGFPYGKSIFSKENSTYPTVSDKIAIQHFITD